MLYSIGKFAKEIGVSTETLRNWQREQILIPAKVTEKGTRYYSEEQLQDYLGNTTTNRAIVIYTRVSNQSQKDDLENQVDFLKEYCNAKGYITEVITDIGSGLNYRRKKWNILIDRVLNKEVERIVIAHKDRFIRFGFDWFDSLCNKNGCTIEIVNNEKLSPQEELVQDLISIIHVFSCRIYGLRKYKKKIKEDTELESL